MSQRVLIVDDEPLLANDIAQTLVASGYDETEASRRFAGQEIVGFIQKPYTSRQLAEKIRTVLDG
jgi:DNA-binding NarL/FixJ family response regulator